MQKILLVFGLVLFFHSFLLAQDRKCGNNYIPAYFDQNFMQKAMQSSPTARLENQTYTIPIIFHLCYTESPTSATRQVSQAQIQSQIEVLNEDYNRFNADTSKTRPMFRSVAANANIRFELADIDPNGNLLAEKGIARHKISKGNWDIKSFRNTISTQTIFDPKQYLNIWVLDSLIEGGESYLGHAQFPDLSGLAGLEEKNGLETTDGVLILPRVLGSIRKIPNLPLSERFAYGRTLSHEIGHFLGLLHTFHDGNASCSRDADYCNDTPVLTSPSNRIFSCENDRIVCEKVAMHENFMDYTDDICMNMFTICQVQRMRWVLENSPRRKELLSSKVVTSGITARTELNIKIYPNPASDVLHIDFSNNLHINKTQILNLLGQSVWVSNQKQIENYVLNLPNLPKGIYFVHLETTQGLVVRKLIIE